MLYILIAILTSGPHDYPVSISAEFNSVQACQAAAKELTRQSDNRPGIIFCAAKG